MLTIRVKKKVKEESPIFEYVLKKYEFDVSERKISLGKSVGLEKVSELCTSSSLSSLQLSIH